MPIITWNYIPYVTYSNSINNICYGQSTVYFPILADGHLPIGRPVNAPKESLVMVDGHIDHALTKAHIQ